jgi:hypothetical protein
MIGAHAADRPDSNTVRIQENWDMDHPSEDVLPYFRRSFREGSHLANEKGIFGSESRRWRANLVSAYPAVNSAYVNLRQGVKAEIKSMVQLIGPWFRA